MVDDRRRIANPLKFSTNPGSNHALDSEQGHLSVVRDRSDTTVGLIEISNAAQTVMGPDLIEGHELDRGTERVAARSSEKAASYAVPERRSHECTPIVQDDFASRPLEAAS